jgi:hypothetical protein
LFWEEIIFFDTGANRWNLHRHPRQDVRTRPEIELTRAERQQVKDVARELLDTLKAERLVLDWRKQQRTRAAV